MHDLNDLFFFSQVVDKGGFTAAARALGIPKSRLSRRVAQLEERLGVRLMQRTTRRFTLTEVGEIYHRHCTAMLAEADAAEEAVSHLSDRPRGTIRVSCPIKLSQMLLASLLPRFMTECPEVRVHLEVTNRRIDLVEEGFDVAFRVRAQRPTEASLTLRMLGESKLGIVASPDYIARHGQPRHPDELVRFATLGGMAPDGRHLWYLQGSEGATVEAVIAPRLVTDDMLVLREAAVAGHGITLLPINTCCAELAAGTLKLVLEDWPPLPGLFYCVFPSRRGLVPAVRRFIDFVAEQLPRAMHASDEAIKARALVDAGATLPSADASIGAANASA
jgi:DNA-binding transcriptional LysR family regulator